MTQSKTWVLVADAHRARLFKRDPKSGSLERALDEELIAEMRPSRDIASDRPGRSFDRGGEGRHAMEPSTDPATHAKQSFASDVADILESERTKNSFEELIIVAPPSFLGDLRSAMSDSLHKLVQEEFQKDISKEKVHELKEHITRLMESR